MLWLCLHFPLLPLEVFTRAGEGAPGALAIIDRGRVLCASTAAQACGIGPGMPRTTAQALCAELRLRERADALEAAALTELADWAYRFTPQLATAPPARLLLEISASLRLFGGLAPLLGSVESELADRRWSVRCGLAPTPLAAELLSRARPCTAATLPAWCGNTDAGAFSRVLGELPLALLEAPAREQQTMQRMGFARIGELFALPRGALGRRFGKEFLRYLMRLNGELPDPRPAHRPREFFDAALHFLDPVHEAGQLLFPMRRLLGELGQFLARRQAFCQRLVWQLAPAHGAQQRLPVACSLEHHREQALLELSRLALERLRLREPVASLALHCSELALLRGQATDLFDEDTLAGVEAEQRLLDRLRLRFGPEQLHGVWLADAHLPVRGQVLLLSQSGKEARPDPTTRPTTRPCWLLREPTPVAGLDWHGPLELLGGPERIENGWWDGAQSRDYFVARSQAGELLWVYRERASAAWFVQGVFG